MGNTITNSVGNCIFMSYEKAAAMPEQCCGEFLLDQIRRVHVETQEKRGRARNRDVALNSNGNDLTRKAPEFPRDVVS